MTTEEYLAIKKAERRFWRAWTKYSNARGGDRGPAHAAMLKAHDEYNRLAHGGKTLKERIRSL